MHFINTLIPGLRALSKALPIKLCREPTVLARSQQPSSSMRLQPRLRAYWRICPSSRQLQQCWVVDARLEPPSRYFAPLMQQLGLCFGVRTFS